jgi:hypothetical protein
MSPQKLASLRRDVLDTVLVGEAGADHSAAEPLAKGLSL